MRILIVDGGRIPVTLYGGTERVIWGLGKELSKMGHQVTFLVKAGSHSDFAAILPIDENKPILEQISHSYDVVHFNFVPEGIENFKLPYIITIHGNPQEGKELDRNAVFVSENHAMRYNSKSFVHNGLDWSEYVTPDFSRNREYFHFLGKAAWRVKNVTGAINVIKKTKSERLTVLGGKRFNFKMGIRFTFSPRISFSGMVGGAKKYELLNGSKGLIFPVKWHEPFGLAIIESLFYGCPVFGTPYGSLPELVTEDFGYLSNNSEKLAEAIMNLDNYSPQNCYEYAMEEFNSKKMALKYLSKYEEVVSGKQLNSVAPKLLKMPNEEIFEWH